MEFEDLKNQKQKGKIQNEWKILAAIFILVCILIGVIFLDSSAQRKVADNKARNAQRNPEMPVAAPVPNHFPPPGRPVGPGGLSLSISGVPVLMYHYIGDSPDKADRMRRDLTVSTADFSAQMDYLKAQGYHSITTRQLYNYTQGSFKMPSKPVIITLDDGYMNAFQNAVPVLVKDGMQGVFAVITAYPDYYPGYADWKEIVDAKAQGMEIIPHTQHHIDLKNKKYSHENKVGELSGSIADIQEHLNVRPVAFIYPYGNYDQDSMDILTQSGIKFAFTVKPGLFSTDTDLLAEPRVRVHGVENLLRFGESLKGKPAITAKDAQKESQQLPAIQK